MFDTFKIKVEGYGWEWDEFKSEVFEFDNGGNALMMISSGIALRMRSRWQKLFLENHNRMVWLKWWIRT